jgi:hypothetical protein
MEPLCTETSSDIREWENRVTIALDQLGETHPKALSAAASVIKDFVDHFTFQPEVRAKCLARPSQLSSYSVLYLNNSQKAQKRGKSSPIRSFGSGQKETGGASRSLVSVPAGIFGDKETLCLYWPLGTVVITGPKVLDFYASFCTHRATCLKADRKHITDLKLMLNGDSNAENEASLVFRIFSHQ